MNSEDARAEQARVEAELRAAAAAQREEFRESFGARVLKGNLRAAYTEVENLRYSRNVWRSLAIGFAALAVIVWLV